VLNEESQTSINVGRDIRKRHNQFSGPARYSKRDMDRRDGALREAPVGSEGICNSRTRACYLVRQYRLLSKFHGRHSPISGNACPLLPTAYSSDRHIKFPPAGCSPGLNR